MYVAAAISPAQDTFALDILPQTHLGDHAACYHSFLHQLLAVADGQAGKLGGSVVLVS